MANILLKTPKRSAAKPPAPTPPAPEPAEVIEPPPSEVLTDARGRRMTAVPVDNLQLGSHVPFPIYDTSGVLLLAPGLEISPQFLRRLRQRGTIEVMIPQQGEEDAGVESAPIQTPRIVRDLDIVLRNTSRLDLPGRKKQRRPKLSLENLRAETARGQELYSQSVDRVANIMEDIRRRRCKSATGARGVVAQFVDFLRLDGSLLPAIAGISDTSNAYLFEHGLNTALMAVAAGDELGYPPEDMMEIGLGAVLQDVGMLRVPEDLRLAPRWLGEKEKIEIQKHPFYSLDLLEAMDGMSRTSMMVAYQAHERCDSSGYPRGTELNSTHPAARIVGVVEACSRPHRNAHGPYQAIEILLRETQRQKFDGQVLRNFLDCVSVFPIGSYVRLNDGHTAKVVRAVPRRHTSPVVVLLDDNGRETDTEVDLSADGTLFITQALRDERDLHLDFHHTSAV